jgi:hypothetical protein
MDDHLIVDPFSCLTVSPSKVRKRSMQNQKYTSKHKKQTNNLKPKQNKT